jgi:hypothetical protein
MAGPDGTGFGAFLRAFGGRWFVAMSGPATVPFAIVALFVESTWAKTLFVLLAVMCAGFASYWVWHDERQRAIRLAGQLSTLESRLAPSILLSWSQVIGPIAIAPPQTLQVFSTLPALTGGLEEHIFGPDAKANRWPSGALSGFIPRCELKNYGSETVFNVEIMLGLTYREAIRESPESRRSGNEVHQHARTINIPVLEAKGGAFVFYMWNQSGHYVDVCFAEDGTILIPGERERRRIPITASPSRGPVNLSPHRDA